MEDKKVTVFRSAAFTVIERKKIYEDDQVSHEQLIYNAGYNAGVLDLVKQLEEDMAKATESFDERIRAIREIIEARNTDGDVDSDIEDYLGGND